MDERDRVAGAVARATAAQSRESDARAGGGGGGGGVFSLVREALRAQIAADSGLQLLLATTGSGHAESVTWSSSDAAVARLADRVMLASEAAATAAAASGGGPTTTTTPTPPPASSSPLTPPKSLSATQTPSISGDVLLGAAGDAIARLQRDSFAALARTDGSTMSASAAATSAAMMTASTAGPASNSSFSFGDDSLVDTVLFRLARRDSRLLAAAARSVAVAVRSRIADTVADIAAEELNAAAAAKAAAASAAAREAAERKAAADEAARRKQQQQHLQLTERAIPSAVSARSGAGRDRVGDATIAAVDDDDDDESHIERLELLAQLERSRRASTSVGGAPPSAAAAAVSSQDRALSAGSRVRVSASRGSRLTSALQLAPSQAASHRDGSAAASGKRRSRVALARQVLEAVVDLLSAGDSRSATSSEAGGTDSDTERGFVVAPAAATGSPSPAVRGSPRRVATLAELQRIADGYRRDVARLHEVDAVPASDGGSNERSGVPRSASRSVSEPSAAPVLGRASPALTEGERRVDGRSRSSEPADVVRTGDDGAASDGDDWTQLDDGRYLSASRRVVFDPTRPGEFLCVDTGAWIAAEDLAARK